MESKKNSTYFICATQAGNLGDLMINKMLIEELCKYGIVYLDAFGLPDEFKSPLYENKNVVDVSIYGFSVKRLSIKNIINYIYFIRKHDVKLITRSPGPLEEPNTKVRFGFIMINILARWLGVKSVYMGNCCSEALSKEQVLKSTYMDETYVRSIASLQYAKKYLHCLVSYIPDMAFLMTSEKEYIREKEVIIDYRYVTDNKKSITDLRNIVRTFRSFGFGVELYYQVTSDKDGMMMLYKELKNEGVTIRKDILWYEDIEEYYSNKAFVVSNRLHSLLFGAAFGVIPIARITKDPHVAKILHVFESSLPKVFSKNIGIEDFIDIRMMIHQEKILRKDLLMAMKENKIKCGEIIRNVVINPK